jgi:hypothetical protein
VGCLAGGGKTVVALVPDCHSHHHNAWAQLGISLSVFFTFLKSWRDNFLHEQVNQRVLNDL